MGRLPSGPFNTWRANGEVSAPAGIFPQSTGKFRGSAERQHCLLDLGKQGERGGLQDSPFQRKITEVKSYYRRKKKTSKQAAGAILGVKKYSLWGNV